MINQYFNDEPYLTSIRVKKRVGELSDEFDIIAVCETKIKSSPDAQEAKRFKNKKLVNFRRLFPEYDNLTLILIFGALILESSLVV